MSQSPEQPNPTKPSATGQPSTLPSARSLQTATSHEAERMIDQTKNAALGRIADVRERTTQGISEQQHALAGRIQRVGSALESFSVELHREEPAVARYAAMAGQKIQSAADYVSGANVETLMRDTRGFASAKPAIFVGGAFLAGLALGRFFKSTSSGSAQWNGETRGMDFGFEGRNDDGASNLAGGVQSPSRVSGGI